MLAFTLAATAASMGLDPEILNALRAMRLRERPTPTRRGPGFRMRRTLLGLHRQTYSSLSSQYRKYGGRPSWMAPLPEKKR